MLGKEDKMGVFDGWYGVESKRGRDWGGCESGVKVQVKIVIKKVMMYMDVLGEGWAPKEGLPLPNMDYYIKIRQFTRPFNTKMKQHSHKTILAPKIQQNISYRNDITFPPSNQGTTLNQELKLANHQTQFLFKKQEKLVRQKYKGNHLESKVQNQAEGGDSVVQVAFPLRKGEVACGKGWSNESLTVKQQQGQIDLIQRGGREGKDGKGVGEWGQVSGSGSGERMLGVGDSGRQKQMQKKLKKQLKASKKAEREKEKAMKGRGEVGFGNQKLKLNQKNQICNQLLQIFRQKYPYYLIDDTIAYPIEDHLFQIYPNLLPLTHNHNQPQLHSLVKPLPNTFSQELQIWNMIVEHSAFFEVEEEIEIEEVGRMVGEWSPAGYSKLFKNLHKFYIHDVIFHRYDDASGEDYYSFISLWRYADENAFLDKLFHTSWNKFMHFYISLQRHYSNPVIVEQLRYFQEKLWKQMERGGFDPPLQYDELLEYLIFLVNMCFETCTFKALINGKMNFFRDNNKMKNELLEEKKNVENRVWELKEGEKVVGKREKQTAKQLKKEQKQHDIDRILELEKQTQDINEEKMKIALEKEKCHQTIIQIDNKIYELCCLPEFSNVWLLGEDRHRNLYWFIREQENAIYREERQSGSWGVIEYDNIEKFHQQLNVRGIKEHKLYEKLLYYKQLGYIKTDPQTMKEEQVKQNTPFTRPPHLPQPSYANTQGWKYSYDVNEFDRFVYTQYGEVSAYIIKLMILKSEWLMSRYLFERNSKWTTEDSRQEYISRMTNHDLEDYDTLTQELRTFNEKICVVEINIKVTIENDSIECKTRKIQTKIWGINERYKHFWYDYSRKCRSLSDLHFLVSILYLTIEKYVTKTRKPNNTKYFFKTVEVGDHNDLHDFGDQDLL